MSKLTIYIRPSVEKELRAVAVAQKKSVSAIVHESLVITLAGAFVGTPDARPLDEKEIYGEEKNEKQKA